MATDSHLETTTDTDGRFILAGTGANRVVCLRLSGVGIAVTELFVLNSDGFDRPTPYLQNGGVMPPTALEKSNADNMLYGPDLSVVAEPEKVIQGVVTTADTLAPRSGVVVWLPSNAGSTRWLGLSAKTDAHGCYEIRGARKAKRYTVEVKSDPESGYLASQVQAGDTPGYQPVKADIRVAKGVVVIGRVVDKTAGQPVPGFAMVGVLSDNPFLKQNPDFNSSWNRGDSTDDGTFRIVTIPGPVLLMGGPDSERLPGGIREAMKYKPVVPDPNYPQYFSNRFGPGYHAAGGGIALLQGNYCKVLDVKPGTAVIHEDIILEQADAIPVKIQDAEARPLTGAWVTGISPVEWMYPIRIEKDSCFAYHVTGDKPRLMVFYEPDKNLVGTLKLNGDENQPAVVKLAPPGAVTGRLMAEGGRPVSGFVIRAICRTRVVSEIMRQMDSTKPPVVTDADGTFRMDGLMPGVEFELDHHRSGKANQGLNVLTQKLTVKPGETLRLGDVRVKPVPHDDEE
jgi:hypothetical protein